MKARKWKMWAVVRQHDAESWMPYLYFYRYEANTIAKQHGFKVIKVLVTELKPKRRRK